MTVRQVTETFGLLYVFLVILLCGSGVLMAINLIFGEPNRLSTFMNVVGVIGVGFVLGQAFGIISILNTDSKLVDPADGRDPAKAANRQNPRLLKRANSVVKENDAVFKSPVVAALVVGFAALVSSAVG